MRTQRTITIWDKCECGKTLMSIAEGERGTCGPCWFKTMPKDTRNAINRLIKASFTVTTPEQKDHLIDEACKKLDRDKAALARDGRAG